MFAENLGRVSRYPDGEEPAWGQASQATQAHSLFVASLAPSDSLFASDVLIVNHFSLLKEVQRSLLSSLNC